MLVQSIKGCGLEARWVQLVLFFSLCVHQAVLLPIATAQLEVDTDSALAITDVSEPNEVVSDDESWWYHSIQESYMEPLVHEFKELSAFLNKDSNDNETDKSIVDLDMFHLLQPNKNSSMVVQFYSSDATDCPEECRNIRDHFMQLAQHIVILTSTDPSETQPDNHNVTELVTFHVINCARHRSLCQQHGITYYPTIRLYQHPENIPPTTSTASNQKSKKMSGIFDISYQHLHPYEVLEKLGITAYDLPDDEEENTIDVDGATQMDDAPHSSDNLEYSNVVENVRVQSRTVPHTSKTQTYQHRSRKQLFHDIHIALDYTLRTLIFSAKKSQDHIVHLPQTNRRSDLTITEQEVLKSFLMLLQKALPSSTDNADVRGMIKAVIGNFMYAVKNHSYMDAILKEYRPMSLQYSQHVCPNGDSDSEANQYTCVMWDILLMMSIGMVDFNIQSYDATEMIHPASALHSIFEYVELFGLSTVPTAPSVSSAYDTNDGDTLQRQFIDLYQDCNFMNRCQQLPDAPKVIYEDNKDQVSKEYIARITTSYVEWKMVPLYIAAVRNMTLPQRNSSFSEVWPPRNVCAVCWKFRTSDATTTTLMQYDETNLYKYLKVEYGHIDAITATYRHELLHESSVRAIVSSQQQVKAFVDEKSVSDEGRAHPHDSIGMETTRKEPATGFLHTNLHVQPQSRSSIPILTMRQGSICMLFLTISLLRWLYTRYVQKSNGGTKGGVAASAPTKIFTGIGIDQSQRTIVNNFDQDESDHCSSPAQRMTLSPRKRQLLNRRFMMEQENERSRKEFSRSSSFRLDQLEASKQLNDGNDHNNSAASVDRLSIPPPLFQCEVSTSHCHNSDAIQHLRQRKSPLVPISKPKVSLHT